MENLNETVIQKKPKKSIDLKIVIIVSVLIVAIVALSVAAFLIKDASQIKAKAPVCGNNICERGENLKTCFGDCFKFDVSKIDLENKRLNY